MKFNREFFKNVIEDNVDLFSTIEINENEFIKNEDFGNISIGFFRGLLKHSIKNFYGVDFDFKNLKRIEQLEEALTQNFLIYYHSKALHLMKHFPLICDFDYLDKRGLNFKKDNDKYEAAASIINKQLNEIVYH